MIKIKEKQCRTCKIVKELSEFHGEKKRSSIGGEYILYRLDCKICANTNARNNRVKKGVKHHYVEINNETKTVAEWSRLSGVKYDVLLKRIKKGVVGTNLFKKKLSTFKDLTGMKFNRLFVIQRTENDKHGNAMWLCECDCGSKNIYKGSVVSHGRIKSCGCILKDKNINKFKNFKHGHNKVANRHRLYGIWSNMKDRCYNPRSDTYKNYGERGIKVCHEWLDYKSFMAWALENGYDDNLTIDRKDNDLGYESSNCRWVTSTVQNRNRRNTIYVEIDGEFLTLPECSEVYGLSYKTLYCRYKKGFAAEELIAPIKYYHDSDLSRNSPATK